MLSRSDAVSQSPETFQFFQRTAVVFGDGTLERLGELSRQLGMTRTLLVADPGLVASGHVDRAEGSLAGAGVDVTRFHEFGANPDTKMVEAGRQTASAAAVDSIVALGGGSSLDCAKGINFVLSNGGTMRDYWGFGKAPKPMLPSIGIPTTAGTGSEAQSYALISDADTHAKMACGDPKAAFRIAILDPRLTVTQPRLVTAIAGYDALSHAVETFVTLKRNAISDLFARDAWARLSANYTRVLEQPADLDARGAMLLGSHLSGVAIEQSMLGATHACANPLTMRVDAPHGIAIAVMLPHVVRWNAAVCGSRYAELLQISGGGAGSPDSPDALTAGDALAGRLESLARVGGLPATLRELGVSPDDLPALAVEAAGQWTGTFNPRPFDESAARALYERAY
jgi:alcohol dehydrogenase